MPTTMGEFSNKTEAVYPETIRAGAQHLYDTGDLSMLVYLIDNCEESLAEQARHRGLTIDQLVCSVDMGYEYYAAIIHAAKLAQELWQQRYAKDPPIGTTRVVRMRQ